ncbi:Ankyrin repeat-containing domain [Cordyceps militaris]|uniref:Ankyrin repeat-containing domain n=1 Tax=Cordyceps militaris TaxID=73501 RepID=A0A2H4SPR7_CORMI|nr:Ankyrin repeat-containing domain [Cordyceps militaris]
MRAHSNCDACQGAKKKVSMSKWNHQTPLLLVFPSIFVIITGNLVETSLRDLEIVAPASGNSSQIPKNDLQVLPGEYTGELTKRFLAALEGDDPMLDISRLAGWLTQIPERLGANELLEKAASAFLDAFDLEEYWGDTFAQSVRQDSIRIVCVESIINPSLVLDSRCLQSIKYEAGPYPSLDEEDGQSIESLDLPFLLRLSHLLRAPDEHREEIRNSYARLKVEWPFTRRRYRYISGICKITGINSSCLVQAEAQLGTAHTLERDALDMGSEALETSRKLLIDLPKGVWLAPVALFASWIATDDLDITCSFFSIIKESNQYWAEPAYIEPAKALKKQLCSFELAR